MRVLTATAAAILITLVVGVPAGNAQAPPEFFGVVTQNPLGPASFQGMGQARVGTVRLRIDWSAIDRSPAPNDNHWPTFDPLVLDAARNGVQVLPFIYGTPSWVAKGLDGRDCDGSGCAAFAPRSQAALNAWERFVAGAVDRYGANGTLWAENPGVPRIPLESWQIWNEENSNVFYAPQPRPKRYMRLLGAASRSIRAHDPSASVLLGGMAELAGSRRAVPASDFLADVYRLRHAKRSFDAVALHPYGTTMAKVRSQVRAYRRVMTHAHDRDAPMYVTEIGAGSATGGHNFNLGPDGQALLLRQMYEYFERKRIPYDIRTVDWFSWQDNGESICLWCPSSGLLTEGGEAKPSYQAFTELAGAAAARR